MNQEGAIRIAAPSDQTRILAAYRAWGYPHSISPDDTIYMLEIRPELVGLVRRTYEYGITMLRGMYVAPKMQGQGFGLRLLNHFAAELNGAECYCLPLAHAAGFYGKVGFVSVPERNIPLFLQERLAQYRARGYSVLAMHRPSRNEGFGHAG